MPLTASDPKPSWSARESAELYRVPRWGTPYFGVSDAGTVEVYPSGEPDRSIDLFDVIEGLRDRDVNVPVVVRFPGILRHRMESIGAAFESAIDTLGFSGSYTCVYPIKVNQERHLCEEVRDFAAELGFGLEVGSKPELIAGLGLTAGHNRMPVICNGFKDADFIETVVLAAKMGRDIIPVVEQARELRLITRFASAHDVRPKIAMRAKLMSSGVGRWAASGGPRGKFGLTISEILEAVEHLREVDMLDCFDMLHCHIGSQIYDIRTIKDAVREIAHLYVQLVELGAPVRTLDLGGGLGIDYDGTQSASSSSINYSLEQYATDVVHRIMTVCDETSTRHPDIVTESGRALVAHSSLLVFDVLGSRRFPTEPDHARVAEALKVDHPPQPLLDLKDAYDRLVRSDGLDASQVTEIYADAEHAFGESQSLFSLGHMDIHGRAAAEGLYWAVGWGVLERLDGDVPEDLEHLEELLGDVYFANLSVFQSLLDSWGIDQVFPIMPIHRLDEEPTRPGTLADITCDSDGRIDSFPGDDGPTQSLMLHELLGENGTQDPYYLAAFMTAAYQETLGDLHNLLGDTHVVHVDLGPNGRWRVEAVVEGDSIREVLEYVQYDPASIRDTLRRDIEAAVEDDRLTVAEGTSFRRFLNRALEGYSYLES